MEKYQNLNVLNKKNVLDYMSDDAIQSVANMINTSGYNRSQRKRLERTLRKTQNIMDNCQSHLDKSSFKQYECALEDTMRRFFAVLGIVLVQKYNFEESDDKEDISNIFNILNGYLLQYRELSTDEVAKICLEKTGIELVPEK